jgi:hypothetical protein
MSISIIHAQELKLYNGTYKGAKATYQYYENTNLDRIYQGKFNFHKIKLQDVSGANLYADITIHGNYKNNLKDGEWVFSSFDNITDPVTDELKVNFLNGKRNGKWKYIHTVIKKGVKYSLEATLNFKNDTLVGNVDFFDFFKGQANSAGDFVGRWTHKSRREEYVIDYSDNLIKHFVKRNFTTGEIYFRYNETDSIQQGNFTTELDNYYNMITKQIQETEEMLHIIDIGSSYYFIIKIPYLHKEVLYPGIIHH